MGALVVSGPKESLSSDNVLGELGVGCLQQTLALKSTVGPLVVCL